MSSGFKTSGTDLDDVFDAYENGAKPAATGFRVGSQDLKDRYNPISEGDAAAATEFTVNGTDLNTLFAAKGTSTKVQDPGFGSSYHASRSAGYSASAGILLYLHPNGTWDIVLQGATNSGAPLSGDWSKTVQSGIGDDYEARFVEDVTVSGLDYDPSINYSYGHTGTTGWLPLSSDAIYSLGIDQSGTRGSKSGPWSVSALGSVTVQLRKVGSSKIVSAVLNFSAHTTLLIGGGGGIGGGGMA